MSTDCYALMLSKTPDFQICQKRTCDQQAETVAH